MNKKDIILVSIIVLFAPSFVYTVMNLFGYSISFMNGRSMFNSNGNECYYLQRYLENPSEDIRVGDIVIFQRGLVGTLHRVIRECKTCQNVTVDSAKICVENDWEMVDINISSYVCRKCSHIGWFTKGDNNEYEDGCIPGEYFTSKYIATVYCNFLGKS